MSGVSENAVILIPATITPDMLETGTTVPVVDAAVGEVAWVLIAAYAVGQQVNHLGRIWESVLASTGVEPGSDGTRWLLKGASNRMAPFDDELQTKATAMGSMTYVVRAGFFTGLALWGLEGDHLHIVTYDRPGGEVVGGYDGDLYEQALGLYELLFMPLRQRTQFYQRNLPLYPDAEVHITISSGGGGPVAVGLISFGHWDTLVGTGYFGGVEYGANAAVKSYSYKGVGEGGRAVRKRRGSATNVSCSVVISTDQANHAMDLLHQVQGRPVAFIATNLPRFDFLSGFGDVSGSATPVDYSTTTLDIKIEGVVQ